MALAVEQPGDRARDVNVRRATEGVQHLTASFHTRTNERLTGSPIGRITCGAMGIELESETRIVIGRLRAPTDQGRSWWWQSSTTVDGADVTVAGFARSENDAILEAAASTIDLRAGLDRSAAAPSAKPTASERDIWAGNGERLREPVADG